MSSYDETLRIMREADRALAPLRDFERMYGRGLQQATEDFLQRERTFRAALPELDSSYLSAVESLQPALDKFREFERHSSAMSQLADAHSGFSALLARQTDLESIASVSIALSPHWRESIMAYERLAGEIAAPELALKSHYASVAESAFLAQERLLRVPWDTLGNGIKIDSSEFSPVSDRFTTLTDTYRLLMQSFETSEHFMASFPPIVSAGPPLEILTSARLLDDLSRPIPEEEFSEVDRQTESDLEDEIEATIDELLAALNPALRSV